MGRSNTFRFDGGAGTYLGTGLLAAVIIVFTLGIATPFAVVLLQRWKATHTYVNGHRLISLGSGMRLFGNWLKWLALTVITLGIYSFWVAPRLTAWVVENTDFDPTFTPGPAFADETTAALSPGDAAIQSSDPARPAELTNPEPTG